MSRLVPVCLVLLLVLPAAATAAPHERDGFVIGFNLGAGSGRVQPAGEAEEDGNGVGGAFRLGWAFDDRFLVGLESAAWWHSEIVSDVTLSSILASFTWYPARSGFFLRAGVGVGKAEITVAFGPGELTAADSGGSFGLGAGHEWRLGSKFALGAALDYHTFAVDGGDFDFLNVTAQLNWYF